jgi:hypothetical protein
MGCDPFALSGALRSDWGPEATALPAGAWEVEPAGTIDRPADDRARRIAAALVRGRRVALESSGPIDELARAVWRALPDRTRRRTSVATWAFANGNRFDLVALPRLAGVAFDPSYISIEELEAEPSPTPQTGWRTGRIVLGGAAVAAGALIGLLTLGNGPARPLPEPAPAVAVGPDRSAYRDQVDEPGDRALAAEALLDLAARFEVPADDLARDDPPALMARISDRLRYRGPLLTPSERDRLAAGEDPDRARALAWDDRVRRFVADRPLPADFGRGPLRWQLDTLAWTFHLDGDPRRSSAEVPRHLADALAVDVPTRPSPLAERYPALADYAAFLGRLPRR